MRQLLGPLPLQAAARAPQLALLREQPRLKLWVTYGLLWGVLALTNPSLLAFLPFSALWIVRQQRQWNRAAIAAAAFLVIVTPWLVRNAAVLGKFIFIRDNAGAELRLGNGPGADGTWMFMLHPSQNQVELEKYKRVESLVRALSIAQKMTEMKKAEGAKKEE